MSLYFESIYRILSIQAIDSRPGDKRLEFLTEGTSKTQDYQACYDALILFIAAGFTQLAEKAHSGQLRVIQSIRKPDLIIRKLIVTALVSMRRLFNL